MPSTGVIWIKSLYISSVLQSSGLGRAAMDALEAMAKDEPLCATTLMLDTVHKEHQLSEDFAVPFYGYMPKVCLFVCFWLCFVQISLVGIMSFCRNQLTGLVDGERGVVFPAGL
ncbi:GNAT family N-acetyltransferase [Candidatus Bathyarchaeota archaeon]|nr:GNAT family N-acetyltransferase [Candidatus Bathyarchaeota archaeon]